MKDTKFLLVFAAGAVGTFPLFVPPFFLPLYSRSLGLSSSTGAALVAGFTFSSGVGRIICGLLCDTLGPLNTLFMAFMLNALSLLALWPVSTTLAPLTVFAILNGASNGGFFSTMPTVVGNVFGSQRVAVAMGMVITGWGGGYLMVRRPLQFFIMFMPNTYARVHPLLATCWAHMVEQRVDSRPIGRPCSTQDHLRSGLEGL